MGLPQSSILSVSVTLIGLKINSIIKAISPGVECSLYVDDFLFCLNISTHLNDIYSSVSVNYLSGPTPMDLNSPLPKQYAYISVDYWNYIQNLGYSLMYTNFGCGGNQIPQQHLRLSILRSSSCGIWRINIRAAGRLIFLNRRFYYFYFYYLPPQILEVCMPTCICTHVCTHAPFHAPVLRPTSWPNARDRRDGEVN